MNGRFFFSCLVLSCGDNCLLFSETTGPRRLKFCMLVTNRTRSDLTKFGPDPPGQPGENPGFLFRAAKIKLRFSPFLVISGFGKGARVKWRPHLRRIFQF